MICIRSNGRTKSSGKCTHTKEDGERLRGTRKRINVSERTRPTRPRERERGRGQVEVGKVGERKEKQNKRQANNKA